MPTLTNIITLLKFAAVALVVAAFGWLWIKHGHDQKTIAGQVQLLAQADTQKNLDRATIAQLRTDLDTQSGIVATLGQTTVDAFHRAQDAELAAAKANAPVAVEQQKLVVKRDAPVAATKTCHDAIEEWRARQ